MKPLSAINRLVMRSQVRRYSPAFSLLTKAGWVRCVSILVSFFCISQLNAHSLTFSQVKIVSTADTVPAGKVWKLESTLHTSHLNSPWPGNGSMNQTAAYIQVNGTQICVRAVYTIETSGPAGGDEAGVAAGEVLHFPAWFPAGTILATGGNTWGLSIIEFTITP